MLGYHVSVWRCLAKDISLYLRGPLSKSSEPVTHELFDCLHATNKLIQDNVRLMSTVEEGGRNNEGQAVNGCANTEVEIAARFRLTGAGGNGSSQEVL